MPRARTFGRWSRPSLALWGVLVAFPSGAAADFTVCNDSFDVLNLAIAHDPGNGFVSEGWWTIAPNRCVAVIRERIQNRYVYVHATDVFNQPVLEGGADFCIDEGRFRIAGPEDCWARGHIAAPFAEVDMGQSENWTLILNLSGRLPADASRP
ncbi:MAG TPA: DUF1036 domain-containing protein [Salibaculum sp.]|nr:DUF1036 domain-containing protein [Salibaculum sp.]